MLEHLSGPDNVIDARHRFHPRPVPSSSPALPSPVLGQPDREGATTLLDQYRGSTQQILTDTSFLWQEYHYGITGMLEPHLVVDPWELIEPRSDQNSDVAWSAFQAGQVILRFQIRDPKKRWQYEIIELSVAELSLIINPNDPIPVTGRIPELRDSTPLSSMFHDFVRELVTDLLKRPNQRTPAIDRLLLASANNPEVLRYTYTFLRLIPSSQSGGVA